jgi:hypothetical protein
MKISSPQPCTHYLFTDEKEAMATRNTNGIFTVLCPYPGAMSSREVALHSDVRVTCHCETTTESSSPKHVYARNVSISLLTATRPTLRSEDRTMTLSSQGVGKETFCEISGSQGDMYEDGKAIVLMMEAPSTSESPVNFHQTTRRSDPEIS